MKQLDPVFQPMIRDLVMQADSAKAAYAAGWNDAMAATIKRLSQMQVTKEEQPNGKDSTITESAGDPAGPAE